MTELFETILSTDNVILALLLLSVAGNVSQFKIAMKERKEAWQYVDRLTQTLSDFRVALEILKSTIKKD